MRITVAWLSEEEQVLHIIFHANWTWDDFQEMRQKAQALTQNTANEVHVIMEFDPDAGLLPSNALYNLSRAAESAMPNMGLVIMVMPSQFWRVVITLLKRLIPHSAMQKNHIVASRQAALELIESLVMDFNAYE